jgi:pyrimidine deaminase RibD-like protein
MTIEEQSQHEAYMNRCIELGMQALQQGNPPVGSLLVVNDHII